MTIRNGEKADLPAALELVKELAVFENAAGEVEVTVEQMEDWGFGPGKVFGFFVAENENRIVGTAIYYFKYSTWKGRCLFLEDIIVTKEERGKGHGKRLFEEVMKLAKAEKVRRLEWQVLNWNEHAIRFYNKYGSSFDGEWINCKLRGDQLEGL